MHVQASLARVARAGEPCVGKGRRALHVCRPSRQTHRSGNNTRNDVGVRYAYGGVLITDV